MVPLLTTDTAPANRNAIHPAKQDMHSLIYSKEFTAVN